MEERLNRLEQEVGELKKGKREVYVLMEGETWREGDMDVYAVYTSAKKAYKNALAFCDWLDFSVDDVMNMDIGKSLDTFNGYHNIRIYKTMQK